MKKKEKQKSLLDLLQEMEEVNGIQVQTIAEEAVVQEKKIESHPTYPLVTLDDFRRDFSKSDKLITARIQDSGPVEPFNKSDFHLINVLSSLAQHHRSNEDVPDYLYVSSAELAKMIGISRQTANTKYIDENGNTLTYLEKRLLSLTNRGFLIKEALVPVVKNGMYLRDEKGAIIQRMERNYFFNCVFSFSTVGRVKGSNVFKIQLAPVFYFYNNLQILNEKMNGIAYAKINIDLVGNLNDHRAMRMYEIIRVKSLGSSEGSFRISRKELIEILDVESSRLKQFLNRVEKNLERIMNFCFDFQKVGGISMVLIRFKIKE